MSDPLVSVITPTWRRHALLTGRCLPSVYEQTYPHVEMVVVSDGPDPDCERAVYDWWRLADLEVPGDYPASRTLRYDALPHHDPGKHWGNPARRRGLELAGGDLIGYLDDDDAFRPAHLTVLVNALQLSGADFAYSQMASMPPASENVTLIGGPDPHPGQIGTPMIVHKRELLDVATWGADDSLEDWQLVERWLSAGASYEFVPLATVDVWPSTLHNH